MKPLRWLGRALLPTVVASVAAVAVAVTAPRAVVAQGSPAAEPLAVAQAFLAAVNAHDLDGAMALWAEDAVYLAEDGHTGGARRFGTGEVRARLEAAFKANQRLDATNFRVADDTVTYDWRATAEPARGLGAPPVDGTDTIRVRGGKIVHRLEQTDVASRLRQASALQAALGRRAAAAAQAVPAAQERGTPIERGTPTSGPWLAAAALSLAGVVALAMFKRPHRQP